MIPERASWSNINQSWSPQGLGEVAQILASEWPHPGEAGCAFIQHLPLPGAFQRPPPTKPWPWHRMALGGRCGSYRLAGPRSRRRKIRGPGGRHRRVCSPRAGGAERGPRAGLGRAGSGGKRGSEVRGSRGAKRASPSWSLPFWETSSPRSRWLTLRLTTSHPSRHLPRIHLGSPLEASCLSSPGLSRLEPQKGTGHSWAAPVPDRPTCEQSRDMEPRTVYLRCLVPRLTGPHPLRWGSWGWGGWAGERRRTGCRNGGAGEEGPVRSQGPPA